MLLRSLYALFLLSNLADDITTYLALTAPDSDRFGVVEANPIAKWIFDTMGLVNGLALEFVLSAIFMWWLMKTSHFSYKFKVGVFVIISTLAAGAAWNNFGVLCMLNLGVIS